MATRTSRMRALRGLVLATAIGGAVVSCGTQPPTAADANAVVLLIDALRADRLGCYGYPHGTSPEIDRLARRGLLFPSSYTTAPWTYSSTASLVTGLYPAAHGAFTPGAERNHTANPYPPALSPAIETIAETLSPRGWRTGLFSANAYVGLGIEQGFEKYLLKQYDARQQTDAALAWMESLADAPFFSIVHYIDVHEPNRPPRVFRKMFPGAANIQTAELKTYGRSWGAYGTGDPQAVVGYVEYRAKRIGMYDASIRFTDQEIGRLVQRIREMRPGQETTFLVTADHGEEFWDHSEMEHELYRDPRGMYGLAHGHSFFEELMRIPMIFCGGEVPAGRLSRTLASLIDVTPTFLETLGILDDRPDIQGVSLVPEFEGDALPQRTLLLDALVYGRDKRGTVDARYKLIASDAEATLLFDLGADPAERTDVSKVREDVTRESVARLDSLYTESLRLGVELRGSELEGAVDPSASQVEMLRALGYVQ